MGEASDELDIEEPLCPHCALNSTDLVSVREALLHPQFGYTGPYGSIPVIALRLLRGETLRAALAETLEEHLHLAYCSPIYCMPIFNDFVRAYELATTLAVTTKR